MLDVQVTIDAQDPHGLASFWAEALGYKVEDNSDLVDGLLAAGHLSSEQTRVVDGRSVFRDLQACTDPTGRRPRLLFQRVEEEKVVKNRVHLDLYAGEEHIDTEVARLEVMGASVAWVSDDRGVRCVTMRDPEGNEFCVT